jgi:hypothetical protein
MFQILLLTRVIHIGKGFHLLKFNNTISYKPNSISFCLEVGVVNQPKYFTVFLFSRSLSLFFMSAPYFGIRKAFYDYSLVNGKLSFSNAV